MDRGIGAAVRPLPESGRKNLVIQSLAGSETVSNLAAQHGVSRKFVYQQTHKARAALDEAFSSSTPDDEVLFELAVTKTWLRQVIVGLTLICRSSYRGVVEFLRDLLGLPVSLGHVHDVLQAATRQASVVNAEPSLLGIRVGLHDEIFQGATPVLAGVDAQSTYCYLLAAEQHRDADTWGVHLLDAAERGLRPDYTIADAGRGLRAGQQAAWGDTPCHGDVFHIQRQCGGLANTLSRLATGATSRRKTLLAGVGRAGQRDPDGELIAQLELARRTEARASGLARDVRTLVQWLRHDVLVLAGPDLATRRELFDFIVAELMAREPEDPRRIRPVRVALL
jgi:transposase-like protein